jgi:hypothetical protein
MSEAKRRLRELLSAFKSCREGRRLRSCEGCEGWSGATFASCPLKAEHEELWRILEGHPDIFYAGPSCLEAEGWEGAAKAERFKRLVGRRVRAVCEFEGLVNDVDELFGLVKLAHLPKRRGRDMLSVHTYEFIPLEHVVKVEEAEA